MANTTEVEVFCSYSHRDDDLRKEFFSHLELLKQAGIIRTWYDGQILAGQEWNEEIERRLRSAEVVLLLISADLLASEYVRKHELPVAMALHQQGQALVIPIVLRPVLWELSGLTALQALPHGRKPVIDWDPHDHAYVNICEGVLAAILGWTRGAAPAPAKPASATVTRRRVFDLGLPRRVPVGRSTVLAVMVRRPEQPGLRGVFELDADYGIRPEEVKSTGSFAVTFPRTEDGIPEPVEFSVVLESGDFSFASRTKSIEVPPDGDSEVCVFLITALRPGKVLVNVDLMYQGRRISGSLLAGVAEPDAPYEPAVQASVDLDLAGDVRVFTSAPPAVSIPKSVPAPPAAPAPQPPSPVPTRVPKSAPRSRRRVGFGFQRLRQLLVDTVNTSSQVRRLLYSLYRVFATLLRPPSR